MRLAKTKCVLAMAFWASTDSPRRSPCPIVVRRAILLNDHLKVRPAQAANVEKVTMEAGIVRSIEIAKARKYRPSFRMPFELPHSTRR